MIFFINGCENSEWQGSRLKNVEIQSPIHDRKGGTPEQQRPPELKTDAGDAANLTVIAAREGENNMERRIVRIFRDAVEGRKADLSGKRP